MVTNQPPQMKNSRNIIAHRRVRISAVTRVAYHVDPMPTCSRRRFLSQTASAGAAALLAPLLPGRARSLPPSNPRFWINFAQHALMLGPAIALIVRDGE